MPRVALLGAAGAMGSIIAGDLRRFGRDVDFVFADRVAGRGIVAVDVRDRRGLARVVGGADVVIASLPYRFNLDAMRGALAARAHYVDLGGLFHMTRRQLALDGAFRRAGRTALLGMGSAPGIVNVLAVHAAEGLDPVREVHCMVGARDLKPAASLLSFGYSPDTLIDEFAQPAALFRGGRLRMVSPLDAAERRFERFPPPIGRVALDTTLHSEVATLPRFFRSRGVREVTFRQSFEPAMAERLAFLVRAGLTDERPDARTGVSPRAVLRACLARLPKLPPGPRHEVLRVRVVGSRQTRIADCIAGQDAGFGVGPDIDTGAPPSIAALWLARGELEARAGVVAPEEVIPPRPFFGELTKRGMRVRRSATAMGGGVDRATPRPQARSSVPMRER